jgi:response regulator RpfG family c-di-GMP phosphodiesterase
MTAINEDQPPTSGGSNESRPGTASGTILIVDDEMGVRDLLMRWLGALGYPAIAVSSADEALDRLRQERIAVALCDIRMPGRDGLWLAEQVRRHSPDTAVVMATGVQDVGSAVTSLRHGVIDYLMKPFGRDRLREAVQRGLEWHGAAVQARQSREVRELEAQQRRERLAQALGSLRIDSRESLEGMVTALSLQDAAVLEHCRRVASRSAATGRALGVSEDGVDVLERAALAHEVEKLALPESLLRKEGPLTATEQELVRALPDVGYALLSSVPYLAEAAEIVRARYERWDGSGYSRGLRGDAIPIGSRILSVVDSFETMIRPRRFQPALPEAEALTELERCSGTHFDPGVVAAFRRTLASRSADTPARRD